MNDPLMGDVVVLRKVGFGAEWCDQGSPLASGPKAADNYPPTAAATRGLLLVWGDDIKKNFSVKDTLISTVDLYAFFCDLLNITANNNNGTARALKQMLNLPAHKKASAPATNNVQTAALFATSNSSDDSFFPKWKLDKLHEKVPLILAISFAAPCLFFSLYLLVCSDVFSSKTFV